MAAAQLPLFYHDIFPIPLPDGHRFPLQKYRMLRERIASAELGTLQVGPAVSTEALLRAHSADYIHRVTHGLLSRQEQRRTGFPSSPQQVKRAYHSAGSTLAASRAALTNSCGYGINLGGGTHHAHYDWGQGYSVFNDVIIAARTMQHEKRSENIVVIDLDVHQGNGTATIAENDPSIFTFSMHGAKNFPFHKATSDLDIALPNETGDDDYLDMLDEALWRIFMQFSADFVIYLAGADPWKGDKLGKLSLTKAGLIKRDERVLAACKEHQLPVAVCMGGGYAPDIVDSVEIMFNTVNVVAHQTSDAPHRMSLRTVYNRPYDSPNTDQTAA